jgi:hypothetical protein
MRILSRTMVSIPRSYETRPIAATHRYALNLMARQIQKAPALEARASYQGRKMLPLTNMGQHDKRFSLIYG